MMGSYLFTLMSFMLFSQTPLLVESFSAPVFPPPGWDTTRSDTAMGYWVRYPTSGANPDSHHARVQTHKASDTLRQGFSELVTHEFDLTAAAGMESLTFWYRFSAASQNLGPDDTVEASISGDSTAWSPLLKIGSSDQTNSWTVGRVSLAGFDGFSAARLRFRFNDRPNAGLASTNRYFWLDSIKVVSYPVGIGDRSIGRPACHFKISPNPARDRVEFYLDAEKEQRAMSIVFRIYDRSGRLIRSFTLCTMPYALGWDGQDQTGCRLPAGVYVCEAVIGGVRERAAFVLLR